MIGQTVSHYKILEKLGEGGMGVVYKAEDTKLKRLVALKFLPQHLTSTEAEQARFLQEAQSAATLNHPNICTIHTIEEYEGKQFIDMEYIDGETLRKKIPVEKVNDAVIYAIQIGEALQEAHSKGIVHRDVKAENIMVNSKNQIKVMDFGLAKLKGSLKLTKTSSTVGTLAYMAPEQIQGGDIDARSDIFSFGVVVFEMLTGRMPFRGEHEAAVMYSIINEEPDSVLKYKPDISPEFDRIIRRALEKDPEDRYQHIDDMVSELRRSQKQSTCVVRPEASQQSVSQIAESTRPVKSKKTIWIAAGAVVVLAMVATFLLFRGTPSSKTAATGSRKILVVLPFENLGAQDQEYFADGITEEITSKLSGLSGLGVIARSSAMQYKKTVKPIKQIGEELGVNYILEGTVRWETSSDGTKRVRVNPQLIKVEDGTQVWSQPSDAVLSDVFKLQSDISSQVAGALDVALLQSERKTLEAKPTDNSEAYDAYLRGSEYIARGFDEKNFRIAEEMFQKAVTLDPNFALGYAMLAETDANLYWGFFDHTEERVLKAKTAAEKALRLAPDLADAHAAMGAYYYHGRLDYDNALKEYDLANKLQPNNANVYLGIASVRRRQGKMQDAITYFSKAVDLDPRSPDNVNNLAETYELVRDYAQSELYYDRNIAIAPDEWIAYSGKVHTCLLRDGNTVSARRVLDDAVQKIGTAPPGLLPELIIINIFDQQYEEALKKLSALSTTPFLDEQFSFVPAELVKAHVYGLMHQPQKEHVYYDSARIIMEERVKKQPDDSRFHSSLGIAYAGLGRRGDALREGTLATDQLPISKEAYRGAYRVLDLARIYTMVGDQDSAIQQIAFLLSIPSMTSKPLFRLDPTWMSLRDNPKFQQLVEEKK